MANPQFMLVQIMPATEEAFIGLLVDLGDEIRAGDGEVLALSESKNVDALEPGSIPYATMLAKWPNLKAFESFWQERKGRGAIASLLVAEDVRILAVAGLPEKGLPGDPIPTIATVEAIDCDGPPGYMVIDGEAYDPGRLEKYRNILFELMRERSSYYLALTDASGVRVLKGDWDEQIFAVSKWPAVEFGRDFWTCDTYQNVAIPIREGVGHFTVNLFSGTQTDTVAPPI